MAIASVVVKVVPGEEPFVTSQLMNIPGVEVEHVANGNIVCILEGQDLQWLEHMASQVIQSIPGVIIVMPIYVNCEDLELLEAEALVN